MAHSDGGTTPRQVRYLIDFKGGRSFGEAQEIEKLAQEVKDGFWGQGR
jgi:hypothetical protein